MELLRFFLFSSNLPRNKLIFHSILASSTNVLTIALLNEAAQNTSDQTAEMVIMVILAFNVLLYMVSQKYIWRVAISHAEDLVNTIRLNLIDKISGCSLEQLERIPKADIFSAINQHASVIALSGLPVVISIQSVMLIVFTLLYVAYLSVSAFLLLTLFLLLTMLLAKKRSSSAEILMDKAVNTEEASYAAITDLLEGFKEVKLNKAREDCLIGHASELSVDARDHRIEANLKLAINYIATQAFFFLTIAWMIFVLPLFTSSTNLTESIATLVTLAIFMAGPINSVIANLPAYTNGASSIHFINRIEQQLKDGQEQYDEPIHPLEPFESLELKEVSFYFKKDKGERSFEMGPVSLKISANEIIFFTGGNGSGKTTLIKALTGLYGIKSGTIEYNGQPILPEDIPSYRNQFTAIFTDFHLFKRFYGLEADPREVHKLLQLFKLEHKTAYRKGEFITQDLSTGQRKRLALIVSILEKRPIMILDEWAADQDPTFRAIFYQELLPLLRGEGRTILAISHDEYYFKHADKRFHVVEGKLDTPPELK